MAQTIATQLGPDAIASPPTHIPALEPVIGKHHLDDVEEKQTTVTQIGPNAVAPPATATAEDEGDLVFHDIPAFPEDVPTAPLYRLSLKKLMNNDSGEIDRLYKASCELGFFYIDLRGAIEEPKRDSAQDLPSAVSDENQIDGEGLIKDAAGMFELGPKVFDTLSTEEKNKYDYKENGSYFGYKGFGQGIIDSKGTRDRSEMWNVSKDDILDLGDRQPNPEILQDDSNRDLLRNFMTRSHAIITLLFSHLNDRLGLPPQTLQSLHRLRGASGDQSRWVYSPPQPRNDRQMSTGEHTDFGSMTILFNKLGGLQILPPDSEQWCYVKPLKGHCICNLGDAMVKFTAGILRSNIHRVVNPPGAQQHCKRLSVVYFNRPEDEVILKVVEGSALIDEAKGKRVQFAGEEYITSKEWTLRRAMGRRVGGDWNKTLGTEGDRLTT